MAASTDPHDLDRFVEAQASIYEQALAELLAGAKRSHWMWFVFPQIAGLGTSSMAQRYAIRSKEEALAYISHPLLGKRLTACAQVMLSAGGTANGGRSAHAILGSPDDLKFRSSMTLFAAVSGRDSLFQRALDRFFDRIPDDRTLALIGSGDLDPFQKLLP
ncbi:DUF1810 domain-containing protein [Rhizobium sp. L80/93]|uniref:DUF1810 domain-containing protein n=1 Tax=Rhizobium sp. E27B/91 TaxID=2819995 RepID=UPI001ADB71FD|nr:DUF1810 domain-containing protein [Rhizobium sp. E27B/91]MBO9184345.1 DUF1810 domain-containing protein [Rhizobium sp. E27B/91]